MSATPTAPDTSVSGDRRRRSRALLAGGLVLGLGAAGTLAAWTDDVVASGVFNAGKFELQGNTTSGVSAAAGWADYDGTSTADTASLTFSVSSDKMSPSQTLYAPLSISTAASSTLDGVVALNKVQATGDFKNVLTYRIIEEATHGANCTPAKASSLSTTNWAGSPSASVNGSVVGGTALSVSKANGANSGTIRHLCLAVTMGATDATQAVNQAAVAGVTTTGVGTVVTWTFTGTSTDA